MKYSKIGFPINLKLSQSVSKNNTVSGGRLLVHEFYVTLVLIPVQTWQNFQVIFPGLKYSFFSTSSALSLCHIRTYSQLHTTHPLFITPIIDHRQDEHVGRRNHAAEAAAKASLGGSPFGRPRCY